MTYVYVVAQLDVKTSSIVNLEVFTSVRDAADACRRVEWAERLGFAANLVKQDFDQASGRTCRSPDGKESLEVGRRTLGGEPEPEELDLPRTEVN